MGASGSPVTTCALPAEYRAAAVPEGLNTTRSGAAKPFAGRSATLPESRRNTCTAPSAAATMAESRRGEAYAAASSKPNSIGPPTSDAPAMPRMGRNARAALSKTYPDKGPATRLCCP